MFRDRKASFFCTLLHIDGNSVFIWIKFKSYFIFYAYICEQIYNVHWMFLIIKFALIVINIISIIIWNIRLEKKIMYRSSKMYVFCGWSPLTCLPFFFVVNTTFWGDLNSWKYQRFFLATQHGLFLGRLF